MVTTEIPTLSSIYPEWRALSDRLRDLSERENQITREMQDIEKEQRHRNRVMFQPPVTDIVSQPKGKAPISDAARALLGDAAPAPEAPADKQRQFVHRRWGDADLHRLGTELAAVREAVAILHPLLAEAHTAGSKLLCDARMGDYRPVAARLSAALIELGDAMLAHDALTRDMVNQGASWHDWRPVDINTLKTAIGEPGNRYSRLRVLLAGAAEGGHIEATAIPAHWNSGTDPAAAEPAVAVSGTKAKARDWGAGMRDALASTQRSLARIERPTGQ